MSNRGKGLIELEEEELKNLLLGIMEGYKDSVIPPFSYFSLPMSISGNGSSSRKRDEEEESMWAENLLKERKRRKQMNEKYSVLQSMVPSLFKINKPSREKIADDTLRYINYLEEEIQRLEKVRKQSWHETKDAKKPVFTKCTSKNSSVNVTLLNSATFLAIDVPFRRGLMTDIISVLHKHQAEILDARFSVNDQNMLTFTATLMVQNYHGCNNVTGKIKEELLRL